MVTLDEYAYSLVRSKLTGLVETLTQTAASLNRAAIDCVDNTGDKNAKKASQTILENAANINYQAGRLNDIIAEMDREYDEISQSENEMI